MHGSVCDPIYCAGCLDECLCYSVTSSSKQVLASRVAGGMSRGCWNMLYAEQTAVFWTHAWGAMRLHANVQLEDGQAGVCTGIEGACGVSTYRDA